MNSKLYCLETLAVLIPFSFTGDKATQLSIILFLSWHRTWSALAERVMRDKVEAKINCGVGSSKASLICLLSSPVG